MHRILVFFCEGFYLPSCFSLFAYVFPGFSFFGFFVGVFCPVFCTKHLPEDDIRVPLIKIRKVQT